PPRFQASIAPRGSRSRPWPLKKTDIHPYQPSSFRSPWGRFPSKGAARPHRGLHPRVENHVAHEAEERAREDAAVALDHVVGRPDNPKRPVGFEARTTRQASAADVQARRARARLGRTRVPGKGPAALARDERPQALQLFFRK